MTVLSDYLTIMQWGSTPACLFHSRPNHYSLRDFPSPRNSADSEDYRWTAEEDAELALFIKEKMSWADIAETFCYWGKKSAKHRYYNDPERSGTKAVSKLHFNNI